MKMSTLKKAVKFMPIAILSFCFAACGGDEPNNPEQPDSPKTVESVNVMYVFEATEDMLRVADIEAAWINPDGTKDNAKVTKTKQQLVSTYKTFPATGSISMKFTIKSPAPADDEKFKLWASCYLYAYEITYSDGSTQTVMSKPPVSSGGLETLGKDVAKYLDRLNPQLSDVSYSIILDKNAEYGISITKIEK